MKQVLSYTKRFIKPIIIGPSFKIIETCFELLTPFIMAKLIDEGIPYHDTSLILQYGIILGLFAILGYCCTMICQYLAATTQERYGSALRHDLFKHVQELSLPQTQGIGANSLITRLTIDIYQIQAAVAMFIRISPRAPFLLIGSALMTYLISPKLALIFLVIIPLILLLFTIVMRHTLPLYEVVQQKLDTLGLLTNESLSGARVIRAFSKQDEQYEVFATETTTLRSVFVRIGQFEAFLNPTTQIIINLAVATVIYFGQFEVQSGTLTQGEIIAVINYIMQISLALVVLVNFAITFAHAFTSAKRVEEVFNLKIERTPKYLPRKIEDPTHKMPAILLDQVSFAYPDATVPLLENISFAVRQGGTLGIIGGTGSGKTTLIRLLGKLYKPTSGTILLDDIPVKNYPDKLLHQKLQIVFQQTTLFRGTIAQNLRMGNPEATEDEIWQALEIAQAKAFVQATANGLATRIEQGGKNLSGGQRQRLTIARSLLMHPDIIIFDDTSSALDYVTDSKLRAAISTLPMTKITVSQRISAIADAEQIIVLDQGKISGLGTHKELLKSNAVYQQIAQSQQALEVK